MTSQPPYGPSEEFPATIIGVPEDEQSEAAYHEGQPAEPEGYVQEDHDPPDGGEPG